MITLAALDPARTALVLVDLMDPIVGLPLEPRQASEVLQMAHELAASSRSADAPVVLVLVLVECPGVAEQPPGSGLVQGLRAEGDWEIARQADHRRLPGHRPGRPAA